MKNVLVLGRERHLVDASTAIIEESGFRAVGVTQDAEALALIDSGRFVAVLIGSGVEHSSRPPVKQHAAARGTVMLEAGACRCKPFRSTCVRSSSRNCGT
jgi:hypothetical protein